MYFRDQRGGVHRWCRIRALLLCVLLVLPCTVVASAPLPPEQLAMTLTPPLYQLVLAPGVHWSSTLKFTNNNAYDLLVYAFAQNFRVDEEIGIALLPRERGTSTNAYALASWIDLPEEEMHVKHGATINIPFTITIPKSAEPGGHYAAILVGNAPPAEEGGAMSVGAQMSSLLLIRVTGDVIERGSIRDFFADHTIEETQKAIFTLRFSNTGNVHVAPQGTIVIRNMFGRERGRVVIDAQNTLGNILPGTVRTFAFEWNGKQNFFDLGRYSARAALTFGEGGAQQVYSTAHFWVIPWIPFLLFVSVLLFFFLIVRFGVRRYVAKAIRLEEERLGYGPSQMQGKAKDIDLTFAVLRGPIALGVLDLSRYKSKAEHASDLKRTSLHDLLKQYRPFLLWLLVFISVLALISYYVYQVFVSERSYQMSIKKGTANERVIVDGTSSHERVP